MRGAYDLSDADALWDRLTRAIDVDDADLVLHLGEVTFMDASTITVFIRARARLDSEGRRFSLRCLSTSADRLIEICTLRCLLEDDAGKSHES